MRGKRHIAQNACISLCDTRRLQDKYITIFAFTLATRRSVSRQTYQTARSFRRTRLRRTVEDACPYSLRVGMRRSGVCVSVGSALTDPVISGSQRLVIVP